MVSGIDEDEILESEGTEITTEEGIYRVGDFVEVEADGEVARPWIAKLTGFKKSRGDSQGEVNCCWLWHPEDAKEECSGSVPMDCSLIYGEREVFLGRNLSDWNPLESIRRKVTVLPYETYCSVSCSSTHPEDDVWYYRQTLDAERGTLGPPLNPTVLRSNPEYLDWCREAQVDPHQYRFRLPLSSRFSSKLPGSPCPVRISSVNPDWQYYHCSSCQWLYTSPNGLYDEDLTTNPPTRRPSPSSASISIICPDCEKLSLPDRPIPVHVFQEEYMNRTIPVGDDATVAAYLQPTSSAIPTSSEAKRIRLEISSSSDVEEPAEEAPPKRRPSISEGGALFNDDALPEDEKRDRIPTEDDATDVAPVDKQKLVKCKKIAEILEQGVQEMISAGRENELSNVNMEVLALSIVDAFEAHSMEQNLPPRLARQYFYERYQNIKRAQNEDLRRRILLGEMTPQELSTCDAKDLAHEGLRKKREFEANRYFQQQVLLTAGPGKLIRKTHKGLEEVAADPADARTSSQGLYGGEEAPSANSSPPPSRPRSPLYSLPALIDKKDIIEIGEEGPPTPPVNGTFRDALPTLPLPACLKEKTRPAVLLERFSSEFLFARFSKRLENLPNDVKERLLGSLEKARDRSFKKRKISTLSNADSLKCDQ